MDLAFWLALAALGAACTVALRSIAAPYAAFAILVPISAFLAVVFRGTRRDGAVGDVATARSSARVATTGAALAGLGLLGPDLPATRAILYLGAGLASTAGILALTRAPSEPGIAARPDRRARADGVVLAGLAWTFALVATAPREVTMEPAPVLALSARVGAGAALGSLAVLTAVSILGGRERRLELGARERLGAYGWLAGTSIVLGALASLLGLARAQDLLPVLAAVAGLVAALVASSREPEKLGRYGVLALCLGGFAVLPALLTAAAARSIAGRAAEAALVGSLGCACGALVALRLADRVGKISEPWSAAIQSASRALTIPDPEVAIERALVELRALMRGRLDPPRLYRFDPESVTTVDAAGYGATEPAEVPLSLAELAREEPSGVLRIEVLHAAAVRRPEVRAHATWMDDRHIAAVVLLDGADGPVGLLALPRADREESLTLGEVRALRVLGDRLAAATAASSALARSLVRESTLRAQSAQAEGRSAALTEELERHRYRGEALARTLAARATRIAYSPAARLALDAIERLAQGDRPLALLVPLGVDALGWTAAFHLASSRSAAALLIVDGRSPELGEVAHWRDVEVSPLVRARGGTLVLLDPQCLPRLVQAYIGAALDDRVGLALVVPRTIDVLVAEDALDERLADAVGDRAVAVPPLADRAEDLRPLAIDILTRVGLRTQGRPLGLEPAALAALTDYDFPANDVELEALLTRAAIACRTQVITRADLVRAGLVV